MTSVLHLESVFPLISSIVNLSEESHSLWLEKEAKLKEAEKHVSHISSHLNSRMHDSEIVAIKLEDTNLCLSLNDIRVRGFCLASWELQGLRRKRKVRLPLTLVFHNARAQLYNLEEDDTLQPAQLEEELTNFEDYRYDEVLEIERGYIRVGFYLGTSNSPTLLDISADMLEICDVPLEQIVEAVGPRHAEAFIAYRRISEPKEDNYVFCKQFLQERI